MSKGACPNGIHSGIAQNAHCTRRIFLKTFTKMTIFTLVRLVNDS